MRLGSLGPVELLLIVMAIVLIFGASKLGDIGGALGRSMREFKRESKAADIEEERLRQEQEQEQAAAATTRAPATAQSASAEKGTPVGVGDYRPPDATTS